MSATLHAGNLEVVIEPAIGGRITSIKIQGFELLVTSATSHLDWGLYPMVPFAGRVRHGQFTFEETTFQLPANSGPHAIHGTVFDTPWNVDSLSDTQIALSTTTGPAWPFPAIVHHIINLSSTRVRCELSIQPSLRMPVQLGWHPWFAAPDQIDFDFSSMLHRDKDGITTTDRVEPALPPVDDCFFEPNAWPRVHHQNVSVEIASDCPYWVRYDAPGSHVCIEPQSGPPNGLNTKPLVIEAGQQFSRWMEIRLIHSA